MLFHLNPKSGNKKTGPIPVTTSSRDTCPTTCPLLGAGCYADLGPLGLHWSKVTQGTNKKAVNQYTFLKQVKQLPKGQLWRHNQAGDLPHNEGYIDKEFLSKLVIANKGKKGFTYTHHLNKADNYQALHLANLNGFTVNLSTDNKAQAVETYINTNLPVVTLLELDAPNVQTLNSIKVVACPAEKSDKVTCENCQLCADSTRDYIIGFRVHGTRKNKANLIAKG